MDVGSVGGHIEIGVACGLRLSVREALILGDKADDIHAEAVNSLFQPPVHHVKDLVADLRVVPVEIRLLLGEEVQVILSRSLIILPGASAEAGAPVIRLLSILPVPPDIVIPVGIIL